MRWLAGLTLLVAALACGESTTEPSYVSAGGPWAGPIFNSTLTLLLYELDGNVTGTAVLDPAVGASQTFDAQGSQVQHSVTLNMTASGFQPFTLVGRVSASRIGAVLNGSGFVNDSIFLAKCPC